MTNSILDNLCDFHHVSFSVKDLNVSVNFYENIFGFAEIQRFERKDLKGEIVFMKLNEMVLELWQFDNQKNNKDDMKDLDVLGFKHLSFRTKNIHKAYESLKAAHIEVDELLEGKTGTYFFTKDPNGFPIEIIELYKS